MKKILFVLGLTLSLNAVAKVEVKYEDFHEGLAVVTVGDKCGYIDKTGEVLIKPKFEYCHDFSEGLASVKIGNKCGYVNKTGKIIIKPQFVSCNHFNEGLAIYETGDYGNYQYGFIDKTGKVVFKFKNGMKFERDFHKGIMAFKQNNKLGFIAKTGHGAQVIIQPKFEAENSIQSNSFNEEGLAAVKDNGKWGFINEQGEWVIKPQFEFADNFHEGLASVGVNGSNGYKQGYIDSKGNWVILPIFGEARGFSNGLAIANIAVNDQWGFIDKEGNWVINPQFDGVLDFDDSGRAQFQVGRYPSTTTKIGFIDKSGQVVVEPKFDWESSPSEGLTAVKLNGEFGFIDNKGEWVITPNTLKKSLAKYLK